MRLPSLRALLHNFFTRIFLSFWAVVVLIAASAAAVTAIDFAATPDRPSTVIRAAKEALDRDGVEGLKVWLAERNRSRPKQRTLIIDPQGREILGQKLPPRPPGFGPRPGGRPGDSNSERGPFGAFAPTGPGDAQMAARGDEGPARMDDGRRFGGSGMAPPPDMPPGFGPPPGVERRDPPRPQFFFRMLGGDGIRWLPFFIRGQDGSVYRVFFDPPPRRGPLSPPFAGWVRAALLAVALGVSGLVSYLLARSISTPVRRLQAAAHTLSAGNLDARAGPEVTQRKDELGTLGR